MILLCYGNRHANLGFIRTISRVDKNDLMQIACFVSIAYCSWAIGQILNKKNPINYSKAFAAYMLGMITSVFFAIAIGTLIDTIIKH